MMPGLKRKRMSTTSLMVTMVAIGVQLLLKPPRDTKMVLESGGDPGSSGIIVGTSQVGP